MPAAVLTHISPPGGSARAQLSPLRVSAMSLIGTVTLAVMHG